MPTVIGQTSDGRDILRYAPEEGCRFQCVDCGCWLRGEFEVQGHWALCFKKHSVFVDRSGRVYHQTVEGLHREE